MNTRKLIDDVLPPLYLRVRGRLRQVLYRHRIPPQDAEDLLQTAFLLAVAKWVEIRDPEAWLLATLENCCIVYWREQRKHRERFGQLDETWAPALAVRSPQQEKRDLLADIAAASRRELPAGQRKLIALRFRLGLSPREAATVMGFARSSVRKTLNRAFGRLRALMDAPPPCGQRPQVRTRAVPALAVRLRGAGGAAAAWMAAVDAYAALGAKTTGTRETYRRQLATSGVKLGFRLDDLTVQDLAAFRQSLAGRSAARRAQLLYLLRSFLAWAGERGEHGLSADLVREALRPDNRLRPRAAPASAAAAAPTAASAGAQLAAHDAVARSPHRSRSARKA